MFSWKIPEDARASGNGILIDGFAGDARFGGSKECIRGSAGEGATRRKPRGSRPVKAKGEAAGANWRRSHSRGRGSIRRKPDEAASRAKERHRCESEVGCRPSRRKDGSTQVERVTTGRSEVRNSRCESEVCSRSSRRTRNRSEPEGWPPVEPECRRLTQVGSYVPAQPEEPSASESWRAATGVAGGRNTGRTASDQD
jgi:hypothetical protein